MPTYRTICLVISSGGKTLLKSVVYSPTINTARQERRTNIDIPRPTITPRSGGSKVPPKNNAPANATSRLKFSKLSDTTLVWHLVVASAWGWDTPFAYTLLGHVAWLCLFRTLCTATRRHRRPPKDQRTNESFPPRGFKFGTQSREKSGDQFSCCHDDRKRDRDKKISLNLNLNLGRQAEAPSLRNLAGLAKRDLGEGRRRRLCLVGTGGKIHFEEAGNGIRWDYLDVYWLGTNLHHWWCNWF